MIVVPGPIVVVDMVGLLVKLVIREVEEVAVGVLDPTMVPRDTVNSTPSIAVSMLVSDAALLVVVEGVVMAPFVMVCPVQIEVGRDDETIVLLDSVYVMQSVSVIRL